MTEIGLDYAQLAVLRGYFKVANDHQLPAIIEYIKEEIARREAMKTKTLDNWC